MKLREPFLHLFAMLVVGAAAAAELRPTLIMVLGYLAWGLPSLWFLWRRPADPDFSEIARRQRTNRKLGGMP